MSDTIQAGSYIARQAALRQQQPSALIEAVESRIHGQQLHSMPMLVVSDTQGIRRVIDTRLEGWTMARGSGRPVIVVGVDWIQPQGDMAVNAVDQAADSWQRWAETTKAVLTKASATKPSLPDAARLRIERLATLQASLGLSMGDLARVLGITRQGLYKWCDNSKEVKVQGANQERLALVERIASQWSKRSSAPLVSVAREPLSLGGSVFDLLVADDIVEAEVVGAFDQLVARLQAKPKSRSQKLAAAGFRRRPSAHSLPPDE